MKNPLLFFNTYIVLSLSAFSQSANDVIITELLADPTPSAGLPESEFIELTNISGHAINLRNWFITDGNSKGVIKEDCVIENDSSLIICATAFVKELELFGKTSGVSGFPSLDNSGDIIKLVSAEGKTIHAIQYHSYWITDPVKAQGGWTLEMIDVHKPCTTIGNWNVSHAPIGGTPGKENSTRNFISDNNPPIILHSYAIDSIQIAVIFDKPLDSIAAVDPILYTINNGLGNPIAASAMAPFFNVVILRLRSPVISNTIYLLHHEGAPDCYDNKAASVNGIRTGLPGNDPDGLIINEILFNPPAGGSDYIELFNAGNSIIDASALYITNTQSVTSSTTVNKCAEYPRLIFPGDYFTLTEDTFWVQNNYRVKNLSSLHSINKLPPFPDEGGQAIILTTSGKIIDVFQYKDLLHFPLIQNPEGVALERIDPYSATDLHSNWFSASGDAGYGTPAGLNSQFKRKEIFEGSLHLSPETFSPDMDGYNDILSIDYNFPQPGFSCSILIFNSTGHLIKSLVRNQLSGTQGSYRWDGLDDKNRPLPTGIYFVNAEIFDVEGRIKKIRKAVILARK